MVNTIQKRLAIDASEALDHVQVFRGPAEPRLVREIGGVDNQRVAFPMADGVPIHSRMFFGRCWAFIRMMRASCTISVRIITASGVWTIWWRLL